MKRYNVLIHFLKRRLKELDAYNAENKKIVKDVVYELENITSLDSVAFTRMQKLIASMDIKETIFDILIEYNIKNKQAITKMIYMEAYKFLKKENLYDAFMLRLREVCPKVKSLRHFTFRVRSVINPLNFFRIILLIRIDGNFDDDDTVQFWINIDEKWNTHMLNILKETI